MLPVDRNLLRDDGSDMAKIHARCNEWLLRRGKYGVYSYFIYLSCQF